ncbi:hypothetical protein Tco_1201482 [Tanacetum coccineum]
MTPTLTAASPQEKKRKQSDGETSSPRKSLKVTIKQKQVVEDEKDEESYASKFSASMLDDVDVSGNRLEPWSHKENLEVIDDDDDVNDDEQKDEKKGDVGTHEMGIHGKVDKVLHEMVPQLVESATNDLIEGNLKKSMADTVIQEQDAFQSEMKSNLQDQANDPALWDVLKRKFEKSSTSNTSCRDDDFHSQHHDDHQEDDAPPKGEKIVKRHKTSKRVKFTKEETVIDEDEVILKVETPELITEFQNVDKRIPTIFDRARMEATLNDINTEEKKYILSLQKIHAKPFPEADMEEKMNRWRVYKQNQRKVRDNREDYFSNHGIIEVVRITTDQLYGLDSMVQIIVIRDNDKPDSFSEADFKYLNKNDIEDLYYLCRNKKVNYRETKLLNSLITFIRSCVIWERVHDFQLGIESYHIRVNLTAPTLTFPGIEAYDPYSIVDKPNTGLIYLNNKNEKRVMYLVENVKFCDATL